MTSQTPLTDQRLDEIEARAAGLYEYATGLDAAWQDEADQLAGTDVPVLLAEVRRLHTELAEMRAARDVLASMYRDADAQLDAVAAVCDSAERQATRWEHPLLVPEWVAVVRHAIDRPTATAPAPSSVSAAPVPAPEAPDGRATPAGPSGGRTGAVPVADDRTG